MPLSSYESEQIIKSQPAIDRTTNKLRTHAAAVLADPEPVAPVSPTPEETATYQQALVLWRKRKALAEAIGIYDGHYTSRFIQAMLRVPALVELSGPFSQPSTVNRQTDGLEESLDAVVEAAVEQAFNFLAPMVPVS